MTIFIGGVFIAVLGMSAPHAPTLAVGIICIIIGLIIHEVDRGALP